MNAADALRAARARLSERGVDNPRLDAEVLLRHVLGLDRTKLFARLQEPVADAEVAALDELVRRRMEGEPIAYITGVREFMKLPFEVGPGVLIPRPESEGLVQWADSWLKGQSASIASTVIDVGTGSGAIILSLVRWYPKGRIDRFFGCDRSPGALAYAARNRSALGLDHRVHLVLGDLASWAGRANLVIANLPYLTPAQVAENPEIHAEPEMALIAGDDGFVEISRLIDDLPRILPEGGAAIFEVDPSQTVRTADRMNDILRYCRIRIIRDLAGLDRYVTVELG